MSTFGNNPNGQANSANSLPIVIASDQSKLSIADSQGNNINSSGNGFLKITDEPHQIFYDSFDTTLDTTNYWTSTQGNSGVAPVTTLGILTMGTGTIANGYSKLISIPTFKPVIPGWLIFSDVISLPDGAAPIVNSYRFWGTGVTPVTPTVLMPIIDGYGFELNIDGKLRAVVYAGGVRTIIADLSSSGTNKQPLDTNYHRWIVQVRTDKTSFQLSQVQILPKLYLTIGNSTPPVSNVQILSRGAVVSDSAKNAHQLADSTFPWRKASISSTGALKILNPDIITSGNLTSLNSSVVSISDNAGTAIVEITGTWVGTIQFFGSNNGFTTKQAITSIFLGGIQTQSSTTTTNGFYSIVTAGFSQVAAIMTAYTSGTAIILINSTQGSRIVVPLQGNPNNNQSLVTIARKSTYRASTTALVTAAGTLPFLTIDGSASKTIIIQRIILSGATLTAVAYINYEVRKYSSVTTGGTFSTLTNVPLDSNNSSATAVLKVYTVAPTAGTLIGLVQTKRILGEATTATASGILDTTEFDFRPSESTGIYLRGTTQELAIAFGTAPASAVTLSITVEWTEE
jgi:hypothetical protein